MTRTPFYDGADFEPGEEPGAHITPECVADASRRPWTSGRGR